MESKENPLSKLRPVSFAIAAENLKLGSRQLEVTPVEWLPYLDGEIVADPETVEDKGVDGSGQEYTAKVDTTNSLSALWLPWGSNRISPPNIRRGERLMLYRFADSDQYYWKELGLDDHLRRLETVIYVFSNTRDEETVALTPDNTYSVEISTHTKQVTFRTSKSDGEPFAYTFQFNTKEGAVTLTDDVGNYFELDSKERRLTLKNTDSSMLMIDKRQMKQYAPDLIEIKTDACDILCNALTIKAENTIEIETQAWTLTTPLMMNKVDATTYTGVMVIQKLLTLMGGITAAPGAGVAQFSVPMNLTAPMNSTSTITANGIGLTTHKHTEQGDGAPVSPPIP